MSTLRAWRRWRGPALGIQLLLGMALVTAAVSISAGLVARSFEQRYLATLLEAVAFLNGEKDIPAALGLLFDVDGAHRSLMQIGSGAAATTAVLSAEHPSIDGWDIPVIFNGQRWTKVRVKAGR